MIKVPGLDKIDVTQLIADQNNVLLVAEGGGLFFILQEPGTYWVHIAFRRAYRGAHALEVARNAFRWMFEHTNCLVLKARVPKFNRKTNWFCSLMGAAKEFERKGVWPTDSGPVDMTYWSLDYGVWSRNAKEYVERGRMFHVKLSDEFIRHEKFDLIPEQDECHYHRIGLCIETIYAGQPEKALLLYNQWARWADFGQIKLVARNPLIIDAGEAVLQFEDHNFKVLTCR